MPVDYIHLIWLDIHILQKQKNNLYGVVSSQLHVDWYVFSDVLLDPLEQLSIDRG